MTHVIDIDTAQDIARALEDVIGFLTDNSCSDPDCCGGPYYTVDQYDKGVETLADYGLKVERP